MELCNNCPHRKKLKYTTFFECEKYGVVLEDNPPRKHWKCLEDEMKENKTEEKTVQEESQVRRRKTKREFIEVK